MIENVIDWLPNDYSLPKDWKVGRVKDLADYQSGKYIDANEIDEEGIYDVYGGNGLRGKTFNYNHNGQYILIGRQGALCGNINIASGMFWATEHAIVVYKKIKYSLKWIAHIFNVMNFNQYSISAAQPGLAIDRIKRLKLPVPPLSEQQAIANYLDAKTQAIDKKISLLEQKIETYKQLKRTLINQTITKGLDKNTPLKDSGISWIGQIPQHWEVKRFKDVVRKYTTGGTPSTSNRSYFDGDNVWISIGDIGNSKYISDSSIYLTDEAIKDANIVKTPKGSLLYSFKLSIGKMAFTTKDVYTNEAILSIFPNKNIDLEYYYFMLPTYLELAATENIYGAKMLNQKLIANALVIHPPKSEQKEIAKYLDHKTATIDAIVGNISKQIDTLKQLRKTLINDVVTGKIKVVE